MSRPSSPHCVPALPALAVVLALSALAAGAARANPDADGDGYGDVWQRIHGVTVAAFPLAEDFDGDGATNQAESEAGTDPRDAGSVLKIVETAATPAGVTLSIETVAGKRYQVKASDTPGGGTWADAGTAATGTGSIVQITVPAGAGDRKFFRVAAGDQDTDGDGATDWEEGVTGTDPGEPNSPANASGGEAGDGDTLRSLLSVTVATEVPDAVEQSAAPAAMRLSRAVGTMLLTLPFSTAGSTDPKKGSASPGDYTLPGAVGGAVTIPTGQASHLVSVAPVLDAAVEVPETLALVFHRPGLGAGADLRAEVKIKDAAVVEANRRLFVAYLGREAGVATTATGVATALVEGDNDRALVSLTFSNLTSAQNTAYIRVGDNLEVSRIPNGQVSGQTWNIRAAQILVTDQAALDALHGGALYVSVSSAEFPGGEIRGSFQPVSGSVAEPPAPPAPPVYGSEAFPNVAAMGVSNNFTLDRDIARFLTQATYGPTPEAMQELRAMIEAAGNHALAGYAAWIDRQMSTAPGDAPSPSLRTLVMAADVEEFIIRGNKPVTFANDPQFGGNSTQFNTSTRLWDPGSIHQNNYPFEGNRRREWWTLVLNSRDQLRQRLALALSEIVVISENDATIDTYHYGTARYWDMLAENAFGSYRTVLEKVTYSPLMGVYLSHLKNQKKAGSISPDENFAREIMQLFSIGLVQRHLDGSLKLDAATGLPMPTYDQGDITEMARVMTGLSFGKRNATVSGAPTYPSASNQAIGAEQDNTSFTQGGGHRYWQASWTNDMKMFSAFHDFNEYTAYTGQPLPAGVPAASKILFREKPGQKVLPVRTASDANGNADITDALNALAGNPGAGSYDGHPNTPVFISRLLIQRFTTSNPSAGYLHRVATVFRNTKGNLGETIKAILLDHEARTLPASGSPTPADGASHGKPKEPLLHFTGMHRALKCFSKAPLEHLGTMPVTFTTTESPMTTAYPATELAKFPGDATRFRWFDTEGSIGQSPQRPPSVFNWFLPDYVVPGPLAVAGLVAPELQVATESNVVNVVNSHFNLIFTGTPPTVYNATQLANGTRHGRGVDDFFNLSIYRNAGGTQLSVPAYARADNPPGSNPGGRGYFLAAQFDASAGSTETQNKINDQLDNILPDYEAVKALYTATYTASLESQHGGAANVPANPANPEKAVAHAAAAEAVLDHYDLLMAAGILKAKYGSAGGTNPRQNLLDALNSGFVGNVTQHSNNASYEATIVGRIKNIAYLVVTSPQSLILK
jgi:uncharacterized protein (DUF1800 family)